MQQNPPLQYRERRLKCPILSKTALVSKLLSLTLRVSFCQHYKYVVIESPQEKIRLTLSEGTGSSLEIKEDSCWLQKYFPNTAMRGMFKKHPRHGSYYKSVRLFK